MTMLPSDERRLIAPRDVSGRRICMFVYNAFRADARVLKEARSLAAAGHDVVVVAVLDKETEPFEERDGFRVVRINRDPPHYSILRFTRRVRRALRLTKARSQRRMRRRMRSTRHLPALAVPRPKLNLVLLAPLALPVRAYRYARWRLLVVFPAYRRRFYRRRSRRRAAISRLRYKSAVRQSRSAVIWDPVSFVLRVAAPLVRFASSPFSTLERTISHYSWRALMLFHKPLMFLDYYRRGYKLVRDEGFDAYHAHDLLTLPVAAALSRSTGAQLIYDAHELYPEISTLSRPERMTWKFLERRLIGRADHVLTVCDSIAHELSERYGVPTPLTVLNCPPLTHVDNAGGNKLRRRAGLEHAAERVILYQGGFAPFRGLPQLVDAMRYVDGAILVMMGWGRIEDDLRAKIIEDGLQAKVVIIPPAAPEELLSYTTGADIGVIPYEAVGLNNYYSTPNKLFEYMGAGIPIAASRFPELRRFVEGENLGRTFDPSDPYDIAFALNTMLADRDALAEMRGNARDAGFRYVWESQAPKLLALYDATATSDVPFRAQEHVALPLTTS